MLKIGVIGYEGHGQAFTEALNGTDLGEKLGMKVTRVWQDPLVKQSYQNMLAAREKLGFQVVKERSDLEKESDGIIVGEERPARYLELARPFLEKKIPTFVNRPVGPNVGDAAAVFYLARKYQAPLLTGSSLVFDPVVRMLRNEIENYQPVQLFYATCPTPYVNFYLPHIISVVVTVFGPGIAHVKCLALEWDEPGWTCKNGIIAYLEYNEKSKCPSAHGIIAQVVDRVKQWYGFRLKVFGAGESPEYNTYQSHGWQEILEAFKEVIMTKSSIVPEDEALEVPKVYYAILRSAEQNRTVELKEFDAEIKERIEKLELE